ncbi:MULTISPECIES: WapI family immunity protein [Exiguobacterium]|uniref:WapI family immunity protein n=1 Tax=Exiguobacterium TaxID=33986 RepID=UPI001BEBAE91|nr:MULTISPECIES: hypothetical protein [Exiguobacterium]MCT4782725.1 hypothetical protein [Exiguobacterium himgiriensis]
MALAKLASRDGATDISIESYSYAYEEAQNIHDLAWHRNWVGFHAPEHRITFDDIMLDSLLVAHYIPVFESFLVGNVQRIEFEPTEPYVCLTLTRRGGAGDEVDVRGHLEHPLGEETEELDFAFETSVAEVEQFLQGLREIAREFPVREVE